MTMQDVEDVVIGLLAEDMSVDPADLRAELEAGGVDLPIDSLLTAEILAAVEEHFGVRLPADGETARNLRSVRRFAAQVWTLVGESAQQAGETA